MPPLFLFAAMGAGCFAAYRIAVRIKAEVEAARRAADEAVKAPATAARDLGALEWDDRSGVYKPRKSNGA